MDDIVHPGDQSAKAQSPDALRFIHTERLRHHHRNVLTGKMRMQPILPIPVSITVTVDGRHL